MASTKLELNPNSLMILEKRYLKKDEEGRPIETPEEMFLRVAKNVASADKMYGATEGDIAKAARVFYDMMTRLEFLPNSPTLRGAGRTLQQLSGCFVIPVGDSLDEIFDALKVAALIHKTGGGVGHSFSRLRPSGDTVASTGNVAGGPTSFMKVFNSTAQEITQGGVRMGANMGILSVTHPDIMKFVTIKEDPSALTNFNISVAATDAFMEAVGNEKEYELINPRTQKSTGTLKARAVFDRIAEMAWKNGDPGMVFIDEINRGNPTPKLGEIESTNPCVTGETLVAVADGKGSVSIKELAGKGEDVPVYCLDDKGKIAIRYMRNPRLTGRNMPVYKVIFDDGNSVRVTDNHKLVLKDGSVRETKHLKAGDSLQIMTKYRASIKDIFPQSNSDSQDYIWINVSGRDCTEHRVIAEFYNNTRIPKDYVVHHLDFNAQNNRSENLRIMTRKEHDRYHGDCMRGENNPMVRAQTEWSDEKWDRYRKNTSESVGGKNNARYSGYTNEEIRYHASELTKKLGRRFSKRDWERYARENDLPVLKSMSKWRKDHLNGSIVGLAKWAAIGLGMENIDEDPRVVRSYRKLSKEGYDCEIIDDEVFIRKRCEVCQKEFLTPSRLREIALCSRACANRKTWSDGEVRVKRTTSRRKTDEAKKQAVREQQLRIYSGLAFSLGREPLKKEWARACKIDGISAEISRPSSPFRIYGDLKEAASMYNHKVVSIAFDGYADVYNGTVDEFHNFFIGGFEGKTNKNRDKLLFINNFQCGEQPLLGFESCNLGSINLSLMLKDGQIDFDKLRETTRNAVHFLDNVIDMNKYVLPQIEEMTKGNRKIGLGVMGFADMLIKLGIPYDTEEGLAVAEKVMAFVSKEATQMSVELAEQRGTFLNFKGSMYDVPNGARVRNATRTTIAPTGTISVIADCSSGIEPLFALVHIRKALFNKDGATQDMLMVNELFEEVAKARGFYSEESMQEIADKGSCQDIPEVPPDVQKLFATAHDISPEWHIRMQAAFQKHLDNAVSKTVNFPNSATIDDVKNVYMLAHKLKCKGVTIYRYGSRDVQVLTTGKSEKPKREDMALGRVPRSRPMTTTGKTIRMQTGCGKLYITINEDDHGLCEVFSTMGKAGGCTASQSEAISRLISLALRSGVSTDAIIDDLKGISCPMPSWQNGGQILSCADAIGKAIEMYFRDSRGGSSQEELPLKGISHRKLPPENVAGVCPECGSLMEKVEGCAVCRACGYTRC